MKLTPADIAFSWCIRERSDWTCERCGTRYQPPTKSLQCSHFFSRDNKAVRVNPDNAFAHCAGCHSHLGSNPNDFVEWVKSRYEEARYDRLVRQSQANATEGKLWKREQKQIAAHYRKELERMKLLREQGKVGRIEFSYWNRENNVVLQNTFLVTGSAVNALLNQ